MIIAGNNHTFIIDSDNNILASGENGSGQLGNGSNVIATTFEEIDSTIKPLRYDSDKVLIKAIAVGDEHSAMVTTDNKLAVTGSNYVGQLGITDDNLDSFTIHPITNNEYPLLIKMVSCGKRSTIILTLSGSIYLTGINIIGLIGDQSSTFQPCNSIFPDGDFNPNWIRVSNERVLVIDEDAQLWYCSKDNNPLLIDSGIAAIEAVVLGQSILIRNDNNDVYSYSIGDDGVMQLDEPIISDVINMEAAEDRVLLLHQDGSTSIIVDDVVESAFEEYQVKRMAISNNSIFIYTNDGQLLATGYNHRYQLGIGDISLNEDDLVEVDLNGVNNEVGDKIETDDAEDKIETDDEVIEFIDQPNQDEEE